MTRVRIRGIYATALTNVLREGFAIVQPSDPIARRFDEPFDADEYDVAVDATDDRQGIGLSGEPDGVAAVRERVSTVGIDTLSWADDAPRGAVFDAEVTDELGRGAVVDLGPREGFLPYDAADGHVAEGDRPRVQVHEPAPPWGDRRPVVGTEVRAFGGIVDLVRGADAPRAETSDPERASELVRTIGMLPTEVPDGWNVRWKRAAADADMDTLDGALRRVVDRVDAVEAALDGDGPPAATAWVWFGRESRFALDDHRGAVVPTMPGHHRIKAAGGEASAAVDFAERLCAPDEFPVEVVLDQFGPAEGDSVRIDHGKPDGRRFALGEGEVVDRDGDTITVRREMTPGGEYDALGIPREAGDTATTKLKEGRWWYPTVYRDDDGNSKGMYVNICTPVELFPNRATYVDLEVDVVRHANGDTERVDDDDLDAVVDAGHVPEALAGKAREVATAVERALG